MPRKRKARHDSDYESGNSDMDIDDFGAPGERWISEIELDEDDTDMLRLSKRRPTRPDLDQPLYPLRRSTRHSSRLLSTEDEEQDDESVTEQASGQGRRQLRARPSNSRPVRNGRTQQSQDDDVDELARDDSDFFPIVRSDLQPGNSSRKRKKGPARPRRRQREDEESIEFEAARRSSRTTRNMKNMADNVTGMDDDYIFYAEESKPLAPPKVIGMKEVFPVPQESDFKDVHSQTCDTCTQTQSLSKGPLIFDRAKQELISKVAGLAYPIRDGIPIMLVDEARPLEGDE